MNRFLFAAALALGLVAGACSTAQLANFQSAVTNFVTGVKTVNVAIAEVSEPLYEKCSEIQATAEALLKLADALDITDTVTQQGLTGANAAIASWCTSKPTDISSALVAVAAAVVQVKVALDTKKAASK